MWPRMEKQRNYNNLGGKDEDEKGITLVAAFSLPSVFTVFTLTCQPHRSFVFAGYLYQNAFDCFPDLPLTALGCSSTALFLLLLCERVGVFMFALYFTAYFAINTMWTGIFVRSANGSFFRGFLNMAIFIVLFPHRLIFAPLSTDIFGFLNARFRQVVRTNQIPRMIPQTPWYVDPKVRRKQQKNTRIMCFFLFSGVLTPLYRRSNVLDTIYV